MARGRRSIEPIAGGKGASLGELMGAGMRVPEGFALSAEAYERFLDEGGIREGSTPPRRRWGRRTSRGSSGRAA